MASSLIISWQIEGEKVEAVTGFIFLGSKITTEGNFSHEIQRHAPWKESYSSFRQHIIKQIHHFAKDLYSQSYFFFPVVMYRFESCTIKKAQCKRTEAFKCGAGEDS